MKQMKIISLAKIQTDFPDIIAGIEVGEEILISSAETQKAVAVIVPYEAWQKTKSRVLGTLQNRGSVEFTEDFAMTDEELLQS
ncbi:MAG: type II toxin-antitoxin system Phd/YefM family antitoxin [Planctomycetaceae bacterium]|nr:type II toxin-antitoxin system Phd/YefM family antitoxin [Planctomycetaceae bacterium]